MSSIQAGLAAVSPEARAAAFAELSQRVAVCVKCPRLAAARRNVVFGVGDINAQLMFIGEAPGADEDDQGEPFNESMEEVTIVCHTNYYDVMQASLDAINLDTGTGVRQWRGESLWPSVKLGLVDAAKASAIVAAARSTASISPPAYASFASPQRASARSKREAAASSFCPFVAGSASAFSPSSAISCACPTLGVPVSKIAPMVSWLISTSRL